MNNVINGFEFVDLGLPSGTLWATYNLGATKPEEFGDYYMWGSVTPNTNTECLLRTAPFSSPGKGTCIMKLKNAILPNNTLRPEYDAANVKLGGKWRIPTATEWTELISSTSKVWTEIEGIKGWKYFSNTDSSKYIFLPASGCRIGSKFSFQGSSGHYWSSTNIFSRIDCAKSMAFNDHQEFPFEDDFLEYAFPIRPVMSKN